MALSSFIHDFRRLIIKFVDKNSEEALLGCIIKHGIGPFVDSKEFGLVPSDFHNEINSVIYHAISDIFDKDPTVILDQYIISAKIRDCGFNKQNEKIEKHDILSNLSNFNVNESNASEFALNIKKNSCFRDSIDKADSLKTLIERNINQDSQMEDLLAIVDEGCASMTSSIINPNAKFTTMGQDAEDVIKSFEDSENELSGIPTGFSLYDSCLGGGLRRGSINLIGARSGRGKSFIGNTIGKNISSRNVPTFYGDTEMEREYQLTRLAAMISGVKINDIESGRFKNSPKDRSDVYSAAKSISKMPYYHEYIGGWSVEQFIAYCKKWLVKSVPVDENGIRGDSLIIFDYLKLMSLDSIKSVQEFQILGIWTTMLHDFATKYGTTILMFVQLNRSGNDYENDAVISGSDRILHLCSSFSIFKEKTEEEIEESGEFGNRKLIVVKSRFGPATPQGDYININSDLSRGLIQESIMSSSARAQLKERGSRDEES